MASRFLFPPYLLATQYTSVWASIKDTIISLDRVEVKEETFEFGEVVQVPSLRDQVENTNFDEWENAIYIKKEQGNHIVALEGHACLAYRLQCRRKQ